MQWFGTAWPTEHARAGVCENDDDRVENPGGDCGWCKESVVGCSGVMIPCYTGAFTDNNGWKIEPWHKECWLRSGVGGLAHLAGKCSCFNGTSAHDSGMSARQEAVAVWAKMHCQMN